MPRARLTEVERKARERMRLVSPGNAGKVLSSDIYWSVPFLDLYLERCNQEAFEDPSSAQYLSVHAPSLAKFIGVGQRAGEYLDPMQKRSYHVYALAVHAGVCRRLGEITEASAHYRHAFDLVAEGGVQPRAEAELRSRFAILKYQARDPEAHALFTDALELFDEAGDPAGRAQTLVSRAGWYWTQNDRVRSALDLSEALSEATKRPKDPRAERAITSAFGNMARLISDQSIPIVECARSAELVRTARKRLSRSRTSLIKMKILWIEGSLYRMIQFTPHALRLLGRARDGFLALKTPEEFALISLEMAIILADDGDSDTLEALRRDTVSRLEVLTQDPLFLEAIGGWTMRSTTDGLLKIQRTIRKQLGR